MSTFTRSDEVVSLWHSLHDGSLDSLVSDTLDRSMVLVIDVPYIWRFHSLPDTSRFHLVLQCVRAAEALKFVSWPGDLVIPEGLSWEESEAIRKRFFEKGRLESVDWNDLQNRLANTEEYEISQASIAAAEGNATTLRLQLLNDDRTEFPEIRITAERIQFFLGLDLELSFADFLNFGESYWQAFAELRPTSS